MTKLWLKLLPIIKILQDRFYINTRQMIQSFFCNPNFLCLNEACLRFKQRVFLNHLPILPYHDLLYFV